MRPLPLSTTPLQALLAPRAVAVIGASNDPTRIGGRALRMLLDMQFPGPVHPVHPTRSEVQGIRAYPSILDIPGEIDCAVLSIPAAAVVATVRQCARRGVRSLVVFSAGFAELNAEGRALQQEMTAIAHSSFMRILGPNCIGLYNVRSRAYLTFYGNVPTRYGAGRNIGLVTQSGGYGAHFISLAQRRDLSVGHWVTTGNECDVELGELLGAFAADPDVDVLVAYIEGIRSKASFLSALEAARRNDKPIVLMKAGRTRAAAAAAAAHTASLAGNDTAYETVFREYGVHRAHSTEEVLDVAYAAVMARGRLSRDARIGVMSNSGGMGVQIADFAGAAGLTLAAVPASVQRQIMAVVPNGSPINPVDLTAQPVNDPAVVGRCLELLLGPAEFATVLLFLGTAGMNRPIIEPLLALARRYPDRLLVMAITATPEVIGLYQDAGFMVFEEPARAIKALAALAWFARSFTPDRSGSAARAALAAPALPPASRLSEADAKAVLAQCGVPAPDERIAATPEAAAAAAASIGFPVAVKILSPDIAHKTELGGVALGLTDAAAVRAAAAGMSARIAALRPDARLDGFLVSPMLGGGVECIVGVTVDPVFGPQIMLGLGGVAVELTRDVSWRAVPVDADTALAMLQELRLYPLLVGYRGRPKLDVGALAAAAAAISALAAANADRLRVIEVNPLLVLPEGQGVVVLDAVIETVCDPNRDSPCGGVTS